MLQKEIFSNATFIKASEKCESPMFRSIFTVDTKNKTEITISGLGFFKLFINGKPASDDYYAPNVSHYHDYENCYCKVKFGEEMKSRIYAMKYDISHLVNDGENVLSVVVGPGWYKEFYGECVLCYKIENGENIFVSGENVKWFDGPLDEFHMHFGEKHNYVKHDYNGDWLKLDFDDSEWKSAVKIALPETEYYIQDSPNDKIIRSITPKKIGETDDSYIYDLGENVAGTFVFKCSKRGETVNVTVSEMINDDNTLNEKWIHDQHAEFICDGSDREYRLLFMWMAFRYIQISKSAELLRFDVIHSDIDVVSSFKSENKVLNWLYETYVRTQLANMHAGIPSDCPHLEKRGYTGDGQLTCEAVMLMFDTKKFYLKWMEDISDSQDRKSGHVQYTAPYIRCGGGPGGWGCAIAEVPYVFYKMFGDIEPARKYFDQMLHYLDYLESHSINDVVVSDQPGLWCLGDWCAPLQDRPTIPEQFVNTYFYIRTIDRICEISEQIGREDVKENLLKVRERKVNAIYRYFYNENTCDFANDANSANAFALDIGLGNEKTLTNLVDHVMNRTLNTGIFGTDLVCKILFANGYYDEGINFLTRDKFPSFSYMMQNGATTLWETWTDPRSCSHPMFGSVVKNLFFYSLGIRKKNNTVTFDNIIVEPKVNDVTGNVSGYIETEKGKISVETDIENKKCTIVIPENVCAEYKNNGKVIALSSGVNEVEFIK